MQRFKALAAAISVGVLFAAAPAGATVTWTFASFSQQLNTGYPLTYNATTKVLSGSGAGIISFNSVAPLPTFSNLLSSFSFTANAVGNVTAVPGSPGVFAQGLGGGHLKFFTGSIPNLLTIDFTGGALWGAGNTWSIEASHGISSMGFSSSVADLSHFDPGLESFNIAFNLKKAISPRVGRALPAFNARFIGQAVIGVVPEPATWAIMLTGFAGVGAALRINRRQRLQAA